MGVVRMKFTSEELMKAMGLKVGDRIKVKNRYYTIEINNLSGLPVYANDKKYLHIAYLLDKEIEILPTPKRVGDRICDQFCAGCPLIVLQCFSEAKEKKSLFLVLDETLNRHVDQEIYDLLKDRLDKEVKE